MRPCSPAESEEKTSARLKVAPGEGNCSAASSHRAEDEDANFGASEQSYETVESIADEPSGPVVVRCRTLSGA